MSENNFYKDMVKELGDENTSLLTDGETSAEFGGWVDTGSYILNAAFSGSLYGGVPDNKITAFAGAEATGKTFFALGLMKAFQNQYDNGGVFHFDSESAVTKDMMESRGIDPNRVIVSEPGTVQDFRTNAVRTVDNYQAMKDKRKGEVPKMMMILDSLGNLASKKELEDITDGKDTRDMTRTQLIRAAFRVLTLKLSKARMPLIVTNHTYQTMEMYSLPEIAGGGGLKYAASSIAMLSKAQDKVDGQIVGNYINVTMVKSRFTKEKSKVRVRLNYETGLDRYYGLLELAEKYEVFKKVGNKYQIGDKTYFGKTINDKPEKFYTPEVMEQLEKAAAKEFKYGNQLDIDSDFGHEEVETDAA